jgi:hypothetical protein
METLSSVSKKMVKKLEILKIKAKHEKDQANLMQRAEEVKQLKLENRQKRLELRKKKVRY